MLFEQSFFIFDHGFVDRVHKLRIFVREVYSTYLSGHKVRVYVSQ